MAGTNQYLTFAAAAGSLTLQYKDWNTYVARQQGFQIGEVDPEPFNTVLRQGTIGTAVLGQIVADYANVDAVDDGSVPNFEANLRIAFAAMLAGAYTAIDTSATVNTITAALSPAPPALNQSFPFFVQANNTNTGPVGINLNGLGLRNVVRRDGAVLQAGDIVKGRFYHLLYDNALGAVRFIGSATSETPVSSGGGSGGGTTPGVASFFFAPGGLNAVPSYSVRTKLTNFGSIANATNGALTWDVANSRLVCATAGVYDIGIRFAQNMPAGINYSFFAGLYRNGSTQSEMEIDQTNSSVTYYGPGGSTSRVMRLAVGDYLEVYGSHNYGTNTTLNFYVDIAALFIGT